MNLQLISALFGAVAVATRYADLITTYQGVFTLGVTEANTNALKTFLLKSPFRLLVLGGLPWVAYGIAAGVYGTSHISTAVFVAVNAISAVIEAKNSIHNIGVNNAARAAKAKK